MSAIGDRLPLVTVGHVVDAGDLLRQPLRTRKQKRTQQGVGPYFEKRRVSRVSHVCINTHKSIEAVTNKKEKTEKTEEKRVRELRIDTPSFCAREAK